MVVLNRIYTRTGDGGDTSLGDGTRVSKTALRVECYGTVDEANAALGLARLHAAPPSQRRSAASRTTCSISAPISAARERKAGCASPMPRWNGSSDRWMR
ncbi:hypothetical protein ruthe_02434 [Rubellimicrobium thermophilum DSM 16684]|uniref:Corrinoid adenosyltransferase n=1 Tax=Rubellimicrobium thermophilum DSM 16684 TaxID=1123069 RepID=S9QXB6_9RHOB|nr:hypothetical protein ruthe_02434 [Rubellimicrobium thermophilum DSM 16684]